MRVSSQHAGSPAVSLSLDLLRRLFADAYARDFAIALWDGTRIEATAKERFELRLNAPYALRAALMPPLDLNPGRANAAGIIDIGGDIEAGIDAFMVATARLTPLRLSRMLTVLLRLPKSPDFAEIRSAQLHGAPHSRSRDAAAVAFHYDQSPDFYRQFLGEDMVYSCAYWDEGVETLAQAQTAKIDYVLRKLRVGTGSRLLDIGCGWGTLAIRAAQTFGVRATGITLSAAQAEYAQRRVAELGLRDLVRIEQRDYRELGGEAYDAIVSIGMAEHVGRAKLTAYFNAAYRSLRPGGVFLNHAIADRGDGSNGGRTNGFVERFVFPDGDLVSLSKMNLAAEAAGFEVRDVENLREHYARTTSAWIAGIEANRDTLVAHSSPEAWRIWRLYLAGSGQGFRSGRLLIFQTLFAKPPPGGRLVLPPTRRDWYR